MIISWIYKGLYLLTHYFEGHLCHEWTFMHLRRKCGWGFSFKFCQPNYSQNYANTYITQICAYLLSTVFAILFPAPIIRIIISILWRLGLIQKYKCASMLVCIVLCVRMNISKDSRWLDQSCMSSSYTRWAGMNGVSLCHSDLSICALFGSSLLLTIY